MHKIEMRVLTAPGCVHCHDLLRFWNNESAHFANIVLREIDILDIEGQQMLTKYHIFALPGVVVDGTLISKGPINADALRTSLEAFNV